MFLWDRLGAASPGPVHPYLADFAIKKAAPKPQARPVRAAAAKKGSKTPRAAPQGESLASVLAEVHSAVEGVTGTRAEDKQPLMEAGLDSLGRSLTYDLITMTIWLVFPQESFGDLNDYCDVLLPCLVGMNDCRAEA